MLQTRRFTDRLAPESRDAILRIKERYWDDPRYRGAVASATIYEAVLDFGVRTVVEFDAYIAGRSSQS